MADLSVRYLGLSLKNPVIAGACGLTGSVDSIIQLEKQGVGAVVLRSLFEEQIDLEIDQDRSTETVAHAESEDYLQYFEKQRYLDDYLELIRAARKAVSIPIIASVNCRTSGPWTDFARKIEAAGAHALELNVYVLPSDPTVDDDRYRRLHFDVVKKVKNTVKLPLALKVGYHFDNLANTLVTLSHTGVQGLTLFNRSYVPDIDIESEVVTAGDPFSTAAHLPISLRWIGLMAGKLDCDLSATTGVHDGPAIVKQLLAGATTVQLASALYRNGIEAARESIDFLNAWMDRHHYRTVGDFRGKLAQGRIADPTLYQRVQFLKHFGSVE